MSISEGWFILLLVFSILAFPLGAYLSNPSQKKDTAIWFGVGFGLLLIWAWLTRAPNVASQMIPLPILSHLEGTASTPIFLFIMGLAWKQTRQIQEKRVIALAIVVCCLYFINGGVWMIQSTPAQTLAHEVGNPEVSQSDLYTCVPSSCAAALNTLGVPTSEAEMATLTRARPTNGSTLIRALEGVREKLKGTGYEAEIVQVTGDQLQSAPKPLLIILYEDTSIRHMVAVMGYRKGTFQLNDPAYGKSFRGRNAISNLYDGYAIVFNKKMVVDK